MPMAVADFLPSRYYALTGVIAVTALASVAALFDWRWLFLAGAAGVLSLAGLRDYFQTRHAILRNYPLLAHFRFFFEAIRPEIRQYLLESDNEACRSHVRNVRLFISVPKTSRAGSRSALAKTCIWQAMNGPTIRCARRRSMISISA